MSYIYKTKGTCSTQIELDLDGDVVHNVKFTGGCNGNLKAIPKLVEGLTVAQVEEKSVELNVDLRIHLAATSSQKHAAKHMKPRSNEITSKIASVYKHVAPNKHVAPKALP